MFHFFFFFSFCLGTFKRCILGFSIEEPSLNPQNPKVQKVKAVSVKSLWCSTHLIHHCRVNYNENQWCLLNTIEPDLIMGTVVLYCHCCKSEDKTPGLIWSNSTDHVTHLWPCFFFPPRFRGVEAPVFFVPIAWPQRPLSGERTQMADMYATRVASTRSFTR